MMSKDIRKTIRLPEDLINQVKLIADYLNLSENDAYKFLIYTKAKEIQ